MSGEAQARRVEARAEGKLYSIEYLRLILAATVVLYHYLFLGARTGEMTTRIYGPDALIYGRFAVSAFFIISGFVIMISAQGKIWQDFLASRVSRLYPALVAASAITFTGILASGRSSELGAALDLVAAWMFAPLLAGKGQIDPAYWSIVVEMRFYFMVLILILLGKLNRLVAVLTAMAILGMILNRLSVVSVVAPFLLFPHTSYFALGVMLHRFYTRGTDPLSLALVAFHLLSAGYGSFLNFEHVDMLDGVRSSWWEGLVVAVTCFTLVTCAIWLPLGDGHRRFAALSGGTSYPLYLVHMIIGFVLIDDLAAVLPDSAAVTLVMLLLLGIATLIHLIVERRFCEPLRRWLASTLRNLAEAAHARAAGRGRGAK